jgi:hypothetical protein
MIITDEEAALAELRRLVQPTADPALDDATEFLPLLEPPYKRASVWAASTAYSFGDVVIPATRNGRRYVCVVSGTGSSTEPSWATGRDATVTDGDATLQEAGREYDLWDFFKAARDGWLLKAAKASEYKNIQVDATRNERGSVYDHCIQMAEKYAPVEIG